MDLKAAAEQYFHNNPAPYQNFLSKEGEELVAAVLRHGDVERMLRRLNGKEGPSFVRIERNRRLGDGLGLRVEVTIPLEINQNHEEGLEAIVIVEVCSPDHPYYPGEVWSVRTEIRSSDMEHWPEFESWEVVLPRPDLPTPIFIEPV